MEGALSPLQFTQDDTKLVSAASSSAPLKRDGSNIQRTTAQLGLKPHAGAILSAPAQCVLLSSHEVCDLAAPVSQARTFTTVRKG